MTPDLRKHLRGSLLAAAALIGGGIGLFRMPRRREKSEDGVVPPKLAAAEHPGTQEKPAVAIVDDEVRDRVEAYRRREIQERLARERDYHAARDAFKQMARRVGPSVHVQGKRARRRWRHFHSPQRHGGAEGGGT